jgi:hypothetical protein
MTITCCHKSRAGGAYSDEQSKSLGHDGSATEAQLEREAAAPAEQSAHSIVEDMADGIEAIHQFMNLAGFKDRDRARAFVLALSTAALSKSSDHVALYDEELAELQGCDPRTVRRQRADYLRESQARHFAPVEVIEGQFDISEQKYKPTLYKLHLVEAIVQAVTDARASKHWHETDRRAQREAIKLAAEDAYWTIPGAAIRRRDKKGPRAALAEIKTCQKVIKTKLERLKEIASKLPAGQREELLDAAEPGELYRWCEEMRAEIEALQQFDSPQSIDEPQVKRDTGQVVRYPPPADRSDELPDEPKASEAAAATWERLEERLTTPAVREVEIALRSSEWPPRQADELEEELTLEEERAAIMQYDGGLTRDEAEALAMDEIGKSRREHVNHQAHRDPE